MKIIDLLNKIANGEEVPKKYRYKSDEYDEDYCYMLYEATGDCNELDFKSLLNDEITIIEDTTEDKKIKRIEERKSGWWPNMADGNVTTLKQAINEIIDRLNGDSDE